MADTLVRELPLVALAGSPNVGKSSIFNTLTGLSQHVGNWPGKTIEQKSGTAQFGRSAEVVDLPGTYSLSANSLEETITRDYIIRERPDVVLVVVSAAALERTLYLLSEVAELPSPVVVAVNMLDVARAEGLRFEPAVLEAALGVPVAALSATQADGYQALRTTLADVLAGRRQARPRPPELGPELEALLAELGSLLGVDLPQGYPRRWLALKLLEGDREVTAMLRALLAPDHWQAVDALLGRHEDAVLAIAGARYEWIGRLTRAALRRPPTGAITLTERLDRAATHPLWGLLTLVGVLGLVYWLVYLLSKPLVSLLNLGLAALTGAVHAALAGAPWWLSGLLANGLVGGVGTVLTLLPVLAFFFAAIAFLEDVGYLARGAFVADRFMHRLGLHGKSFLPLFLGMGCNVPAVLGARILDSRRDRLLTILLIPLVPCAGRMAVLIYFSGALYGSYAPLVILGLLVLDVGVIALTGLLLRKTLLPSASPAFIMELPLYHLPNLRTIALYTWQHMLDFIKRAGTVILAVSLLIWALAAFPSGQTSTSWLAAAGRWMAPLGAAMGFDWRMLVALLASVVAKEQTIASLAILTAGSGAALPALLPALLTPAAGIAFLVVQMLFIPCIGTVSAIRSETGSWRLTLLSVLYLAVTSFGLGILIYQLACLLGWGV
ncbi:MAG: ferrous iron transport protein B [Anaerolineae bacterium]